MQDQGVAWFPTKVDWWLKILLLFPLLACVLTVVESMTNGGRADRIVSVLMSVFVVALYTVFIIPTRYGISSRDLIIRYGIVRQRIELSAIEEVAPTRSPLSSPALSLDRLAIRSGTGLRGTTLISPRDRKGFLDSLSRTAGLRREGERLFRG